MVSKKLFDIPDRIETERLYLRGYKPGDGPMYFEVGQKNREHLKRYESDNVLMSLSSEEEAETMVRDLAAAAETGECLFIGVFDKETDEFVAQIYVGVVSRELPEFNVGYIVDVDHEGRGYVTEAVKAALQLLFAGFNAHRVSLECDETNSRSLKVAERCGFIREGFFRENKKNRDGSFGSTLHYAILRDEFAK